MAARPHGVILIDPTIKTEAFEQALGKMKEDAGAWIGSLSKDMKTVVDVAKFVQQAIETMNLALERTNAKGQWELAQALSTIKMEIGATVTQMLVVLLPAAVTLENTLATLATLARQAAQCVALVFGKQVVGGYGALASGADSAATAQKKLGKSTKAAAKAAKEALAPFDDLHVLQKELAGSGGNGGGGSAKLADIEGVNSLSGFLALSPTMLIFLQKLKELMDPLSKISLDNLAQAFENLKSAVGEDLQSSLQFWEWLWFNILVPAAKWAIEDAIPAFLGAVAGALRVLTSVVDIFKEAGIWLFDHFLKPIAKWTGGVIVWVLKQIGKVLEGLAGFLKEHKEVFVVIIELLVSLAAGFGAVMLAMKAWNAIGPIAGMVASSATKIVKGFKSILETVALSVMMHPYIALFTALAGAIVFFVAKVNEANENARQAELDKRFGKITYSMERLEKECNKIQTPFTKAMESVKRQSEKAKEAAANVDTLAEAMDGSLLRLSLTLDSAGIDEQSKEDAKEQALAEIDAFTKGVNTSILEQKLTAQMQFEAVFGDDPVALSEVLKKLDEYMAPVMDEAAELSEKLRHMMVDALADGVLDEYEQQAILGTTKRLNEIQQRVASHEAYVEIEKIRLKYKDGDGRLSLEGFGQLQGALKKKLQADFDNQDAMHIETLAWLDMVYENDPENLAKMKKQAEEEHYKQKINLSWEVQTVELRNFNQMLAGYGPEIQAAKSMDALPKLGDYLEEATKYVVENAAMLGIDLTDRDMVAAHINGQMQQMYQEGMSGIQLTDPGVAKELLAMMEPDVADWLALKDAYIAQGKSIPEEVEKALLDYEALRRVAEASEGVVDYAGAGVSYGVTSVAESIAFNGGKIPDSLIDGMESKKEQINLSAHGMAQEAADSMELSDADKPKLSDVIGEFKLAEADRAKAKQEAAGYGGDVADAAVGALDRDQEFQDAAADGTAAYMTGLGSGKESAGTAAGEMTDSALDAIETKADDETRGFAAQGKAADTKYAKGMTDNTTQTTDKAAKGVVTGAITTANTAISDKEKGAATVGKNFDEGVAKGITDNAGTVYEAVKKLAKGMIDALNTELKIKSPSRVGAESGGFLVAGVAQGILGSVGTAVRAVSTLGQSIRDAMGDMELIPGGFSKQLSGAFALATPGAMQIPVMATGTVMTQGARMMQAGAANAAAGGGSWMDEDGMREMIREEVGDLVRGTAVHFKGPGAKFVRALSPELDRETKRRGVKLVTGDV